MFCPNCGKENVSGGKYCISCGAYLGGVAQNTAASQQYVNPAEVKPKKKKRPLVSILVTVVCLVVGSLAGRAISSVFIKSLDDDKTPATSATQPATEEATEPARVANPEYTGIFTDRYIVRIDTIFFGLDSAAFAVVNEDGSVHCWEFGYQDDIVCEYLETLYIDISELSESDRELFDSQIRAEMAGYEAVDCATVTYSMSGSYYMLGIRVTDLDQEEVLRTAVENGLLVLDGEASAMSMSATRKNLLDMGYVER